MHLRNCFKKRDEVQYPAARRALMRVLVIKIDVKLEDREKPIGKMHNHASTKVYI